ncbi:MAG: LCP family protein [Treponema sp.]|jgi:anionic cell wall polymer biosynthesis LytR-Cps2A-Psr (LCP) family protein|nr:LCP family protein [Treponema sp.]
MTISTTKKKVPAVISWILIAILGLTLTSIFVVYAGQDYEPDAVVQNSVNFSLFIIENDKKPLASYVVLYYPGTKRAAIFEIPSNIGLILRRINRVDRIDTVYDPYDVRAYQTEVESLLGIKINNTITIEIKNLGKIVDLIEGVTVLIPDRVEDSNHVLLFPSGQMKLDGDKARLYLMYTPTNEQDTLSVRNRRFFVRFLERLAEQNDYLQHSSIKKKLFSFVETSLGENMFSKLLDEYSRINFSRLNIQTVNGTVRENSGQLLLFPSYNGGLIRDVVEKTVSELMTMNLSSALRIKVQVLNGTTANGLARRTAELLREFGYDVTNIGNAERTDYQNTLIIDYSGDEDILQSFANSIRCKNIERRAGERFNSPNTDYNFDFILIIGTDFDGRYVTSS